MEFSDRSSEELSPSSTWQKIVDWAQTHYRDRIFRKDEQIPARPQLIYLVNQGAVRLVSQTQNYLSESLPATSSPLKPENSEESESAFLGFVAAGQPFEVVSQSLFNLQAYAHVDYTQVAWLYWQDLDNWPDFRQAIYENFREQHQRKLLWLSALGQRRTIDRLTCFLMLLAEEYGQKDQENQCLPYTLTHAQIGSAIGSTRVTVTRLMGKLRRQGIVSIQDDNTICINPLKITAN